MPYHVFGVRAGAAAVISAWTFLAMARSGSCILAIAASSSVFPSALAASALSSRTRSRAAAFSSALNPLDAVSVALVRFARFCVVLVAVLVGAILCAPVRELTRDLESIATVAGDAGTRCGGGKATLAQDDWPCRTPRDPGARARPRRAYIVTEQSLIIPRRTSSTARNIVAGMDGDRLLRMNPRAMLQLADFVLDNPGAAEEAVQQAFVAAWRQRKVVSDETA